MKQSHSVNLIKDECIGCTDCIKRCPTEAIRVRAGKAAIIDERCIDCGMCIRVCRNKAKVALTHKLGIINDYKYRIALPAPTLYGQFNNISNVNIILTALKSLGFDDIFETARAAEFITEKTIEFLKTSEGRKPVISSACPVIIRLISQRFPSLIGNILPIIPPVEAAAMIARQNARKAGILDEDIGIFFISPCSAKATYAEHPIGIEKSEINGVISIQDVFLPLKSAFTTLETVEPLCQSSGGAAWAGPGGESSGLSEFDAIAVDGIENVISVLEAVENGQINDVNYIEALACTGGCLGGPLAPINGFVAKNRLSVLIKNTMNLPDSEKRASSALDFDLPYRFNKEISTLSVLQLDENMASALEKMERMDELSSQLPLIDCGSCGAPTCRALAEDIVRGTAHIEDCIFMLRERVVDLAERMLNLSTKMPKR